MSLHRSEMRKVECLFLAVVITFLFRFFLFHASKAQPKRLHADSNPLEYDEGAQIIDGMAETTTGREGNHSSTVIPAEPIEQSSRSLNDTIDCKHKDAVSILQHTSEKGIEKKGVHEVEHPYRTPGFSTLVSQAV